MTGTYRILATNQHGSDEAEVEITVLSAPGKPGGPLKVADVTKSGCKLAWKKPEDDGGKTLFILRYLRSSNTVPTRQVEIMSTELRLGLPRSYYLRLGNLALFHQALMMLT